MQVMLCRLLSGVIVKIRQVQRKEAQVPCRQGLCPAHVGSLESCTHSLHKSGTVHARICGLQLRCWVLHTWDCTGFGSKEGTRCPAPCWSCVLTL